MAGFFRAEDRPQGKIPGQGFRSFTPIPASEPGSFRMDRPSPRAGRGASHANTDRFHLRAPIDSAISSHRVNAISCAPFQTYRSTISGDSEIMLEARELTRKYGDHLALDRLNLSIRPGEIFCLLGANGAGKTTTINLFLNFIDPSSGAAFVDGMNVVDHALECRKRIAYIPENVMLYKNLTGLENLRFFAEVATGTSFPKDELRIYLKRSGLPEQAFEKRISSYSKGMRQKVGIAVALAKSAKALLLDEPTSGLDPKASNEFSKLLCEMSESGVAVLMATHDLFRAKESGTRLGIMRNGVLSMECSTKEVSHSDLERIYLDCMED